MVRCCGGAGVDCETERSGAGVDCCLLYTSDAADE